MRKIIENFLEKYRIPTDAGFLIAVSGGADSISLLHLFKYMNLRIQALHCNFGLRGKESNMDEQFVKRFCDSYGIPLSVKKFDTLGYARQNSLSIEMAARELRYNWFREMKEKKKMDYIVTGHHADDLAETVLINMCRGTSIKGLTGIKPINGDLLRPLLDCSRTDILQYIQDNQLGYRTDSTNNSLDFVRNKIRHRIIPVCKEINPAFLNVIRENCETLKETEQIYRYAIGQLKTQVMEHQGEEILIHIGKTLATPAPCTLLYELLTPFGFNKTQIRDIFNSRDALSGKQFLSENYTLVKGRTYWRMFCHTTQTVTNIEIPKPGEYTINDKHYRFEIIPRTPDFQIPDDSSIACLDADKLGFPLKIRNWEKGDRFCPLGMKKLQKKISDFFIDQKFSTKQKKDCLLLLSGEHIAWVIGHRPDERFKIISVTQNILKISVSDKTATQKT